MNTNAAIDAKMQDMAENVWHVRYISLYQELCTANGCAEYADAAHKIPMMDDDNHLNQFGANLVIRRLVAEGRASVSQDLYLASLSHALRQKALLLFRTAIREA